jgi:hypothetical protein
MEESMKTFLRITICLMLLLGLIGLSPTKSAEAQSYPSYVSGITMVNLGKVSATVQINYFVGGTSGTAGTVYATATESIAAGAIVDYAAIPVNPGFSGSVVISSSEPLGAMSTITGGGVARGSYVGSSVGSKTVLLPFLAKNHGSSQWNTYFAVQNIGSTDTQISIDYAGCNGVGTVDQTAVVKANSSLIFNQKNTACLANGITSATITSTVSDIIAVVSQESLIQNAALVSAGFSGGSTTPVIPLVNANNPDVNGWRTAITIMNVGNQQTTVTLTYKSVTGSSCYEKQTIPAGQSKVFAGRTLQLGPVAGVESNCPVGQRLIGAAYVANNGNSSNQPLVAIVNQDRGSFASAYGSFDRSGGSPAVVMPLIMDNNGQGQWGTSFNVMNVGTTTTYVKCTFLKSSYVATAKLEPLGVFENLQRDKLGVKITSATCRAYSDAGFTQPDSQAKIVAVVNERALIGSGDLMLTYEAINTQ